MLLPRQKAIELVRKMNCQWVDPDSGVLIPDHEKSIECALIAVNELIENTHMYIGNLNPKWVYWNDVKKILEEL